MQTLTMQSSHSHQVLLLLNKKNFSVSIVAACNDTDIRLVGVVEERNNFEGRVEICLQGQWGTGMTVMQWLLADSLVLTLNVSNKAEHFSPCFVD